MMELRRVTALLVSKYNIDFASPQDSDKVWREARDYVVAKPGRLDLVFQPRSFLVNRREATFSLLFYFLFSLILGQRCYDRTSMSRYSESLVPK